MFNLRQKCLSIIRPFPGMDACNIDRYLPTWCRRQWLCSPIHLNAGGGMWRRSDGRKMAAVLVSTLLVRRMRRFGYTGLRKLKFIRRNLEFGRYCV
jgi:hypothetical protein